MQNSARRLLVVEDDTMVARALSRTLARHGFAVSIARSCSAARALTQRFDFAVLDLDLPDGNGVDLAHELIAKGRVPWVLFFTGSGDSALLGRARRVGALVMKVSGTNPILALLSQAEGEDAELSGPASRTAAKAKARPFRAASGSGLQAAPLPAAVRKSRAR